MTLPSGGMMTINLHNFEEKTLKEMTAYITDVRRRMEKTNMAEAMFEVSLENTLTGLKAGKFLSTFGRLFGAKTGKHKVRLLKGAEKKAYYSVPKEERITKTDIEQGTITVSNLGSVYRGSYCTGTLLEVIPPQVSVIGIGGIVEKPGVYTDEAGKKQIGRRNYLPFNIVFDHRALDFGDVSPFMERMDEIFAAPMDIFNW
jgi:pyruvate dehydrogenase E2 component (dihydrolipoamide acetyltransferase)